MLIMVTYPGGSLELRRAVGSRWRWQLSGRRRRRSHPRSAPQIVPSAEIACGRAAIAAPRWASG